MDLPAHFVVDSPGEPAVGRDGGSLIAVGRLRRPRPFRTTRRSGLRRYSLIDKARLKERVLELVQIDSHSRKELAIALHLKGILEGLAAPFSWTTPAPRWGGEVGNLVAHFDGTVDGAEPMLLSAHMDTVAPGEGGGAGGGGRRHPGSDGTTVLGGDDKSGIAIILEVLEGPARGGAGRTGTSTWSSPSARRWDCSERSIWT